MPQGTDMDMDDIEIIRAWLAPDPKNWPAMEALDRMEKDLDALKAEKATMCEVCRWENGFGARKPVGGHTHPVEEAEHD